MLELIKILPTFIVGLIALRIAWQQAETSRQQKKIAQAKLKFDLFTRRLAVYQAVMNLADASKNYKSVEEAKQALQELILLAYEAEFLFGKPVNDLVTELCTKVAILGKGLEKVAKTGSIDHEQLPELRMANDWIKNAPITNTFRRYMDLSDWS